MSLPLCSFRTAWGAAAAALLLASCGGGGNGGLPAVPPPAPAADAPVAIAAVRQGASPFISFVDLQLSDGAQAPAAVHWRIAPKPDTVSKAVDVRYATAYLARRGYGDGSTGRMTIPVFGLYANHLNQVALELQFGDGSVKPLRVDVPTAAYVDPSGIYDRPRMLKTRAAGEALGFDFFYMKSARGSPVIVDSDGQVRWVVPGPRIPGVRSSATTAS